MSSVPLSGRLLNAVRPYWSFDDEDSIIVAKDLELS